jgi:hypothetical protein
VATPDGPPTLPEAVGWATVPRYFAPSQWSRMEACPLSAWARAQPALPEPIEAVVGRIFHRARELVMGDVVPGDSPGARANEALDAALVEVARDTSKSIEAQRSSIQRELGRCKWIDLVGSLRRWTVTARDAVATPLRGARAPVIRDQRPDDLKEVRNAISFGLERTWVCNELRLRGRPDESRKDVDLTVEVREYKSSASALVDGPAHDAAEVQVRLYLLMAERLTGRVARGFLVGRSLREVMWDQDARGELGARVDAACSAFPIGERLPSEALARPGDHCARCDLRPRCRSYLAMVPAWWRDTGAPPRPLPLDVWGRIEGLECNADGVCAWLRDASGRLVVIRGLSPAWRLDRVAPTTTVHFFGLESSEDLVVHGRRVHPSAFHESTRTAGRKAASRLRIFTS